LEDETNAKRDKFTGLGLSLPSANFSGPATFKAVQAAWTSVLRSFASPISANFRGQLGDFRRCTTPGCGYETTSLASFLELNIIIPSNENGTYVKDGQLVDWIRNNCGPGSRNTLQLDCEKCKVKNSINTTTTYITYLPNYIIMNLKQFDNNSQKIGATPRIPRDYQIDMEPCFVPPAMRTDKDPEKVGEVPPFIYDIYAVVHHRGTTPTSGHYWTLARHLDKTGRMREWNKYDDTRVNASKTHGDIEGDNGTPYIYLLRRRGVDDELQYDQLQKYGIPDT
jgi:ubiquitin C-terminal hydrolase